MISGVGHTLSDRRVFGPRVASPDTISCHAGARSNPKEASFVVSKLLARVMAVQVQADSKRVGLENTASTPDTKTHVWVYLPYNSSTYECWPGSQDASHTITDIMEESSQKTYWEVP